MIVLTFVFSFVVYIGIWLPITIALLTITICFIPVWGSSYDDLKNLRKQLQTSKNIYKEEQKEIEESKRQDELELVRKSNIEFFNDVDKTDLKTQLKKCKITKSWIKDIKNKNEKYLIVFVKVAFELTNGKPTKDQVEELVKITNKENIKSYEELYSHMIMLRRKNGN